MKYNDEIITKVVNEVFDTAMIKKGDLVLVALSGGEDSMCLFDILYKLSTVYDFELKAIHINHNIRGKDAKLDMLFVDKYTKSFDVKVIKKSVKVLDYVRKNKLTIEEAARKLRYDEFEKIWKEEYSKREKGNAYIALAHHMNDQAETIIHNILRGTGIRGLAAMEVLNKFYIRPLLNVEKDKIKKYIKKYDIPYVNDKTNDDIKYTRNYIRKEILPKFIDVNSKSISHINYLSENAKDIISYIDETVDRCFAIMCKATKNEIEIDLPLFNKEHNIIKKSIIRKIFTTLVSTLKDITKVNIDDVIKMASSNKGGHIDLPYNITADKKQKKFIFKLNKKNISMQRKKHI